MKELETRFIANTTIYNGNKIFSSSELFEWSFKGREPCFFITIRFWCTGDPDHNILLTVHLWWPVEWGWSNQKITDEAEQSVKPKLSDSFWWWDGRCWVKMTCKKRRHTRGGMLRIFAVAYSPTAYISPRRSLQSSVLIAQLGLNSASIVRQLP